MIKALAIAFNVLKGAILFARVAMLSLLVYNPVGLAIKAIVSVLAGIAWLLWKNWELNCRVPQRIFMKCLQRLNLEGFPQKPCDAGKDRDYGYYCKSNWVKDYER